MPYFVYGSDSRTGEILPRFFSDATTPEDARKQGEVRGMQVTAAVPCNEAMRPADPSIAAARDRVATRRAKFGDSEQRDFDRELDELTPNAYVAYTLIAVNVIVYVLMTLSGAKADHPSYLDLLRWGAEFGPWTTNGEWWRLFTVMFVHIGFVHLLNNMIVLGYVGATVERMVGKLGFALLYVVSGLAGSLWSLYVGPMFIHAGASGAIFGVYGALLAILICVPVPERKRAFLMRFVLVFLAYGVIGALNPQVGFAAHVGGFLAGFLCGLVLAQPATVEALEKRPGRNLIVLSCGVVLIAASVLGLGSRYRNLGALQAALSRFDALDAKVLALPKYGDHDQPEPATLDAIRSELAPAWQAARDQLQAVQPVPTGLQGPLDEVLRYMRLREESWTVLLDGSRRKDPNWIPDFKTKMTDAARQEWKVTRAERPRLLPLQ